MNELIERTAKAMALADAGNTAWKLYLREARAAVAIVIEECAKVSDRWPESIHDVMEHTGSPVTAQSAAASIARRIRDIGDGETLGTLS